jgi:hypothetical protein
MAIPEGSADQRLLLVGGEHLAERIQLGPGGGAPEPPQTFGEARARLAPQVEQAQSVLGSLPDALRARRLLFEATVLPNYLANSHYPEALFDEIGVVPVGTRAARGVYETPSRVEEDAPAKTYVLSADDSSLPRLDD